MTPLRLEVIRIMKKMGLSVDIYGAQFRPVRSKIKTMSNYTYSLCMENSYSHGYVTEKLLDGYIARTIPIYWGGISESILNQKAFINIDESKDIENTLIKGLKSEIFEYENETLTKEHLFNDFSCQISKRIKGMLKSVL